MMQRLLEPEVVDLDPATQAVVDEVCIALDWANGNYLHLRFGEKWWTAFRHSADHVCRQRILEACEQIVRNDEGVFISSSPDGMTGPLYPRETIRQHDGMEQHMRDEATGEMRRVLRFPVGYYATGNPCYERQEVA